MTRLLAALLLVIVGAACEKSAETTEAAAADVTVSQAPAAVDVWERSRQCAADAERLASRLQREAAQYDRGPKVIEWNNHYNRKESRCYVVIVNYNSTAKGSAPLYHRELYDAVEGVRLGGHTGARLSDDVERGVWCFVADPKNPRATVSAECSAAERFIAEQMTN